MLYSSTHMATVGVKGGICQIRCLVQVHAVNVVCLSSTLCYTYVHRCQHPRPCGTRRWSMAQTLCLLTSILFNTSNTRMCLLSETAAVLRHQRLPPLAVCYCFRTYVAISFFVQLGTCESFFFRSNRISNRIGRPIRFRIESSNRIGRIPRKP